ncbi:hypothetical protein Godav_028975 [Gossypium davidsonii]|uniref:hAT-like transposase RNase-H fold domain-containing protein n=1 Tax=Gossypium davidsonii TaxID=34287 RepID=A0A7J8TEU6_GOSDV|nr:hypothetical protein [Gossypium davidsonii]
MASSNAPIHVDDGFNEYESALKHQKSTTSKVWEEMTKLECENKDELKAQSIFIFLVCGKYSFRTVEELGFRSMMSIFSPNFKNISRPTTTRDVLIYYAKEIDHVKEKLAKAFGLGCLTSDDWNSEHTNDEYIFVTTHWVDKDCKLQKKIIRFRALSLLITLDNTSCNDVIVSYLKNYFRANQALLCDGVLFQARCCAHILNLIVKVGLELANDVIGKIRNEIKCIKMLGIPKKRFDDGADKSFHPHYKQNYVQYCFTTIYGTHALDFVQTILSNLKLLFDKYVKNSKSISSYLAKCSNVWDNDPVDSSLHQLNVNRTDLGGDYDESDDSK